MPTPFSLRSPCPIIWNSLNQTTNNPSKEESIQFLQEVGIIHQPRFCEEGHEKYEMNLKLDENEDKWKCRKTGCQIQKQLKRDTWLHGEQSSYSNVLRFIYYWSKEMATLTVCEKELGMKEMAVVRWNNYITEVCATDVLATSKRIGGCGMTIEIDEGLFVRRSRYSRSTAKDVYIYGGVCRETKDCFMVEVKERNAETLQKAIEKWVKPGTTIVGDVLDEYSKRIKKEDRQKYKKLITNESYNFSISSAFIRRDLVVQSEGSWYSAKKKYIPNLYGMLKTTNRTYNTKQYFCQFMWRQKIRKDYLDPFDAIIEKIATYFGPDVKECEITYLPKI